MQPNRCEVNLAYRTPNPAAARAAEGRDPASVVNGVDLALRRDCMNWCFSLALAPTGITTTLPRSGVKEGAGRRSHLAPDNYGS